MKRLFLLFALPVATVAQTLSDFSNFTPSSYSGSWSTTTSSSGSTSFAIGNFGSGNPQNDGNFLTYLGTGQNWSGYTTVYLTGFAGADGAINSNATNTLSFYIEDIEGNFGVSTFSLSNFNNSSFSEQSVVLSFGAADPAQILYWGLTTSNIPTANFAFTFDRVGFSAAAIPEPATYAALGGAIILLVTFFIRKRKCLALIG